MKITDEMLRERSGKAIEILNRSLPDERQIDGDFSPKFESKMKRLLRRQRRTRWINALLKQAKHASVVAVCVGIGVMLLTEPGQATLTRLFEQFISFTKIQTNIAYQSKQTQSDQYVYALPTKIPSGYIQTESTRVDIGTTTHYTNGEDGWFIFEQDTIHDGNSYSYDTADSVIETVTVLDDMNAIFIAGINKINVLIWTDRSYQFTITGVLSKDEMIKIANSTKYYFP